MNAWRTFSADQAEALLGALHTFIRTSVIGAGSVNLKIDDSTGEIPAGKETYAPDCIRLTAAAIVKFSIAIRIGRAYRNLAQAVGDHRARRSDRYCA
ncbi:MAG TPA: hypothetical protein VIY52_04635 [Streptosporangiaceae bacterium]